MSDARADGNPDDDTDGHGNSARNDPVDHADYDAADNNSDSDSSSDSHSHHRIDGDADVAADGH